MMTRRVIRWRSLIASLVIGAAASAPGAARAEPVPPLPARCEIPDDLIPESMPLPHARRMVRTEHRLKIVALGSSSTLGLGASDSEAAWPARLQAALAASLPDVEVRVINRGIARQSAQQMLDRIDSEVLSEKPVLVIWESGTAEAVRGSDVDEYTDSLMTGIDRLAAAKIDVILMDTQYSRGTAEIINFDPYVDAIDRVAAMHGIARFPRSDIMRYWVESDRFEFTGRAGPAARQTADRVYDCLGRLLARTIIRGIMGGQSQR